MPTTTVWTKQHTAVYEQLQKHGRYTAKRSYIQRDLQEQAPLVLEVYDWLVQHHPQAQCKPADADYPVWVSFTGEATMLPSPGSVVLELRVPHERITPIHIAKWGTVLNYAYIPLSETDDTRHQNLLREYGISDTQAYMSQFYPQIKREITDSWQRLFDPNILLNSNATYGTIWEIRKEWIVTVKQ
ncbi:MAG: DUF3841 domain-containing protein [Bacteroidia bacterium]|nr:DUF3841 domain-containing protein [Bacteroidia bacterium]